MEDFIKKGVDGYEAWRNALKTTLEDYRVWLKDTNSHNGVQDLRLYDHIGMLERDQLVVILLAEYSRGKTETINALFFADFNQRLLPSEAGRTTMCPTEILWDSKDDPSIKLLPIETRKTDDSLTYLKTTPNAWEKFRLNVHSADEMKQMLVKLTEQKEVTLDTAISLGLWNENDLAMQRDLETLGTVSIPVWRHAVINYPHPLLKSGLVIIDTPGLNALGAEPELTFSIINNAHAVVFLTATDTGVTQSDLQIWNEFIKDKTNHKLAVLNKVDVLWDPLKSDAKIQQNIERQILNTAHQLNLNPDSVIAISAQKALLAKIKKDEALLDKSGIKLLEIALANIIVNSKQNIIGKALYGDCNQMLRESRYLIQGRLNEASQNVQHLRSMLTAEKDGSKNLMADVINQKKRYEESIPSFNEAYAKIEKLGKKLLLTASLSHLENTIEESKVSMGNSWTTIGLNQSMRALMKNATNLANEITDHSQHIQKLAENVYKVLHAKHGFDLTKPPALNMSEFILNMQKLEKITDEFCSDPINMLTEKHFLIRRFFVGLGAQAEKFFKNAESDCEIWVTGVLATLKAQLDEHKTMLEKRTKMFIDAQNSFDSLKNQIDAAEDELQIVSDQAHQLDNIMLTLIKATKPKQEPVINKAFDAPVLVNSAEAPTIALH